ncbi:MAG: hypothetical protein E7414_02955 [Ruminococcaceae bacterium]|nr:hypothetical protein [Oscillospiraceae bacterium]
MQFLNEYAAAVITVSLLALLLDNLLPGGSHKKYVSTMVGLLVMLVILRPLTALPHYSETFSLPQLHITEGSFSMPEQRPYVAESFEKKLALSMEESLHAVFGTVVSCRISCDVNETGQITGIRNVKLQPYTGEAAAYIAEQYGIEEACIGP